ncbi:MAG: DUF3486 family protein [Pseudopelagicola sp.]|nr:DUF3486 family protein [Pseudopelagicola sp.]
MPPPRKIDLIPTELRERLKETLAHRGFGDIVEVTDELNFWLEEEGLELRIGKTAVGNFSKLLKDQREAFAMAETLLGDMDIEQEGEMHRVLMQMIATSAMQLMQHVREQNGHLDPKDLMSLGRMLKDLMSSAGIREKIREDERVRIAREARESAAEDADTVARELGMTSETAAAIKARILGV